METGIYAAWETPGCSTACWSFCCMNTCRCSPGSVMETPAGKRDFIRWFTLQNQLVYAGEAAKNRRLASFFLLQVGEFVFSLFLVIHVNITNRTRRQWEAESSVETLRYWTPGEQCWSISAADVRHQQPLDQHLFSSRPDLGLYQGFKFSTHLH